MKGDLVVDRFLNYGPRSLPRFLMREDESSRKNHRRVRFAILDKSRLRCEGISATAIIPAGTRCEPAGLKGEAFEAITLANVEWNEKRFGNNRGREGKRGEVGI
jgi:hypothetical protein